MNVEDLTLKQINELRFLFNNDESNSFYSKFIGEYVICRTCNEGINAGFVKEIDRTGIVLEDSRRLYYHEPKDKSLSWYEGVAKSGLSECSKVSSKCTKVICEDYSITICSDEAKKSILEFKTNAQY